MLLPSQPPNSLFWNMYFTNPRTCFLYKILLRFFGFLLNNYLIKFKFFKKSVLHSQNLQILYLHISNCFVSEIFRNRHWIFILPKSSWIKHIRFVDVLFIIVNILYTSTYFRAPVIHLLAIEKRCWGSGSGTAGSPWFWASWIQIRIH